MYTAAELEFLIKTCSANGVTQLKAGDVCVTFSGYRPPVTASAADPLVAALQARVQEDLAWETQNIPPPEFPPEAE